MKEVGIYEIKIFDIYSGVSRIHQASSMELFVTQVNSYKLVAVRYRQKELHFRQGVSRYT